MHDSQKLVVYFSKGRVVSGLAIQTGGHPAGDAIRQCPDVMPISRMETGLGGQSNDVECYRKVPCELQAIQRWTRRNVGVA